ncbi:MAG: PaaI family thioesterase [Syntrophomonadaceae bacterium]|nr:PaaI family thioesterase [Syntrophomonadaceae bacterium]
MTTREELRLFNEGFRHIPYHQFIDFEVTMAEDGKAEIRVPVKEHLINLAGMVHGGFYYTLCDLAAFAAAWSVLKGKQLLVTSDINVSVLAAQGIVPGSELVARAELLKAGRRLVFVDAEVFNHEGTLLAAGRVTKTVLPWKNGPAPRE